MTNRTVIYLSLLFIAAISAQHFSTQVLYNPVDRNDVIHHIQHRDNTPSERKAMQSQLEQALKLSLEVTPTMSSSGHILTELHPPVRITATRATKVRRIPHPSGEIIRRVASGTPFVATSATPDLLWLKIGENEFVPTRDCNFSFPDEQRSAAVLPIEPPLEVHVASKTKVIVRKIPNEKGKAVGFLMPDDTVKVIAVTPDYSYCQIGQKQFVPSVFLKSGDPLVVLSPPLTIHITKTTSVYDMPHNIDLGIEGNIISTLHEDDVVEAIAATSDHEWLKIAPGSYIKTSTTRMGLPRPKAVLFDKPLLIKISAPANVIKNPLTPDVVIRQLRKGDQLQVFGVTEDFNFLQVAKNRYISTLNAKLVSPISKEVPLSPPILVKLKDDENIRHIPDPTGRVMVRGRKGDKFEAIGVSEDFQWIKVADRQWIPFISVSSRREEEPVRVLPTPLEVTLKEDVVVRGRPDYNAKKKSTVLPAGTVITVIAATPDAEWLKIKDKEFIPSSSAVLLPVPEISPLIPSISAVLLKDGKLYRSPNIESVVVQRIPRGEVIQIKGTTTDLKWLKVDDNKFIQTEFVSHVPSLVSLVPAIEFVSAIVVKARNVPAFSGMGLMNINKGEVVVATETTPDYKWVKIGEGRYLPTSALLLSERSEQEGVDMLVLMKKRSGEAERKAERGGKVTEETLAPRRPKIEVASTTPVAARKMNDMQHAYNTLTLGEFNHLDHAPPSAAPASSLLQKTGLPNKQPLKQVRVVADTPVMNGARKDSTQIKLLRKGTFVNVYAVDNKMNWLQVGPSEFIELNYTDIAEQVKKHQL